jgi:hypothetical protein
LDVKFLRVFSYVAGILDNLAFQRLKSRSAKNKILQETTLRHHPFEQLNTAKLIGGPGTNSSGKGSVICTGTTSLPTKLGKTSLPIAANL